MQKIFYRPILNVLDDRFQEMQNGGCYREYDNAKADFPMKVVEAIKIENISLGFFTIIDDEDFRTGKYYVDIPPINGGDEWNSVFESGNRLEAIAYAKEHFGADDDGMICIVSHS